MSFSSVKNILVGIVFLFVLLFHSWNCGGNISDEFPFLRKVRMSLSVWGKARIWRKGRRRPTYTSAHTAMLQTTDTPGLQGLGQRTEIPEAHYPQCVYSPVCDTRGTSQLVLSGPAQFKPMLFTSIYKCPHPDRWHRGKEPAWQCKRHKRRRFDP